MMFTCQKSVNVRESLYILLKEMILYCTQEKCIVHDSRNEGDFWLKKVLINVHSIINGTVFGRTPTMVSLLVVHSQKEVYM